MNFIPARESRLFTKVFGTFVRLLFRYRFKRVWIRQEYHPGPTSRTVYYLNHHSWWDGIIPLLLNEKRFRQNARALMEDKQMRKYRFFRRIGAFSINREEDRKALISLRYAVQSMKRAQASLYIYPEGKITPAGTPLSFEGGLAWIHGKVDNVDFVPVGIYMHTIRHAKPELHLHIGKALSLPGPLDPGSKTARFERELEDLLDRLRSTAGFDDSPYERLL